MEVIIKRKQYDDMVRFLQDKQDDTDWKAFLDSMKSNKDLLEFVKNYLVSLKCVFTLKLYLMKLFSAKQDKCYQEIVYDIILHINESQSEFSSHLLVKNLLLIQMIKISVLDSGNKEKLQQFIITKNIREDWLIELLENFEFYPELAILFEANEDYDKSLFYYKKAKNDEKIKELSLLVSASKTEYLNQSAYSDIVNEFTLSGN
jgi:hypothetical protein